MKMMWKPGALLALVGLLALASCQLENEMNQDAEAEVVVLDEAYADAEFNWMEDEAEFNLAALNLGGREAEANPAHEGVPCRTVTVDRPTRTVTVDFGRGCLCRDGKVRKGKLIITYSDPVAVLSRTVVIRPDNFFVNDNRVEGVRTRTHVRSPRTGTEVFQITLVGGKITFTDGSTVTREATWTRTETGRGLQKQISIEGGARGQNRRGEAYVVRITTPLLRTWACASERFPFPVSGVKEVTVGNRPTRTIDFGDGSCDNLATLTINGVSRTITLQHKRN